MSTEKIDIIFIALALSGVAIVIAVVFLFGIFIRRKNKILKEQFEEQLAYQNRLHQSELKALRSQMNPHFVHNSLNAIQYYIQRNEVEISEDYLVKFSKLIRLFFEYSRRQNITIEEEINLLKNYLEIEKLRFEDKINYKINVDPKIDITEQTLPAMMLQPIVENAINHGLFHKKEKGNITISFKFIDEFSFEITIEDDGIGFLKTEEIYKTSKRSYQSHSSSVLKERLELFQLSNEWNVTYVMEDLSVNSERNGTKVTLIFKEPKLL